MPDRPIDVLRRELLAVLNRAEQATAWEHRARAAEAALREVGRRRDDAALLDDMAAMLRTVRGTGTEPDSRLGPDMARIDALLARYDAAHGARATGSAEPPRRPDARGSPPRAGSPPSQGGGP